MELLLLKAFQFRTEEELPYRVDGRGGFVFHGVGSQVLWSDLRDRWYRFAFEVTTVGQPADSILESTQLVVLQDGVESTPEQSVVMWEPQHRTSCSIDNYSSYRWSQQVMVDCEEPGLFEVRVRMKFSDQTDYLPVDGVTRVLVDKHQESPPTYYSRPIWWMRRLFGKQD